MAMFVDRPVRPALYERFVHPTPTWFSEAGFGLFVHWGAYSVPAWAEPTAEHGSTRKDWFLHNPYAEWYFNTIRLPRSPAQQRQRALYGGAPYDDFLDQWTADAFRPDEIVDLARRAGMRYIIPTTKHHDGICLWDAPGSGRRNTVHRGPRRDIVAEFDRATRSAGLRFGVYYSGGLDWHAADTGPITDADEESGAAPRDARYATYATKQVLDLIQRHSPDVLWGDIDWPEAGIPEGPISFTQVLDAFYAANPDGLVNDRWGLTHWDFRTSEYQAGRSVEQGAWENCRGVGLSFGYNQNEGPATHLTDVQALRHLLDVRARGGNFLLNVGPDASGQLPPLQRACLEGIAAWMGHYSESVHDTTVFHGATAPTADQPWVRWTASTLNDTVFAAVEGRGLQRLQVDVAAVDVHEARIIGGPAVTTRPVGTHELEVEIPEQGLPQVAGPIVLRMGRR